MSNNAGRRIAGIAAMAAAVGSGGVTIPRKPAGPHAQRIRTGNDPALRTPCEPINPASTEAARVALELIDTLNDTQNGVGLAAPQIGRLVRIIALKPNRKLPARVLFNPKIVWRTDDTETDTEGCLSYPGVFVPIERARSVKVRFTDQRGRERTELFTRFDARIVQHEIDHLNGVCLVGDEWRRLESEAAA